MNKDFEYVAVDFNPFGENEIEKVTITNEPQRELWLSCILGGDEASLAYNESVSLELRGVFYQEAFKKAIDSLIARHEALRSTVSKNGENLIIYKELSFSIITDDLTGIDLDKRLNNFHEFVQKEMATPFDLYEGPLFRIYLHKIEENVHYFTLIIHHIIGDGWSIGIILEDLSKMYNSYVHDTFPQLEPAEQISDYTLQQINFTNSSEYIETQNFWINKYKHNVPTLNLPIDYTRPSVRTYTGQRNDYILKNDLLNPIKLLSAKAGSSVVITLLSVFEILLHHRTGQQDIVIGLPSSGQAATGNFGLVGHCVNLLPLDSKVDPKSSFLDYLKRRKGEVYDAYDFQRLTFSELLKKLPIKRDKAHIPLVPIVFNIDMGMDEKVSFDGLTHRLFSNARVAQTFEISLNVTGSKNAMTFEWAYNTNLFRSDTIDSMMSEFESLLKTVTDNPEVLIKDSLINKNPFPTTINQTLIADRTILDLFNQRVLDSPDSNAVVYEGKKLTYNQLNEKSNQLANHLISKGVKTETLVAICIKPSIETIIGIIGILKAGAAYIPIDPEFPEQRISYMISESTASMLICDTETIKRIKEAGNRELICLDDSESQIWHTSKSNPTIKIFPENLIYVIYTSGSTGNPKGVMIEHGSIMDYFEGLNSKLNTLKDCKSFALGSTIATDLGNTILFNSLISGGELHLFAKDRFNNPEYIHQYFNNYNIDCLKIVPSHWRFLRHQGNLLLPSKLLMFGGESLPGEYIKEIRRTNSECVVVNHYGPTETTIGKLIHVVDKNADYPASAPIGKPFGNTILHVLNKDSNYCAIGVPGELYIGGFGVARGYLNNPELTSKMFTDRYAEGIETGFYKTGDLVRWLANGDIEFLGRIDDQVKIRGNRIELGEIQNALLKCKDIRQCAIIVDEDTNQEKRLVAYVVVDSIFNKDAIINHLKLTLPEFMVPRILIQIDKIPLTANGKLDRKSLPKAAMNPITENGYVAPGTAEQNLLTEIWVSNLGINKIGITDDFFELGGHSLIAVKVMGAIEKKTGLRLPLSSLFENPTIETLAKLLTPDDKLNWDSLVPLKTSGNKPPIYLVHGGGLNVFVFKSISGFMDEDQPVYALQGLGLNGDREIPDTIEEIAAKYNAEILESNPEGPYLIAGYSMGGKIAYEMAKQLLEKGKEIKMLGIFDTYAGSSATGIEKVKEKIVRQLKKGPFIAKLFLDNPMQTLSYQLRISKRKLKPIFLKNKEIDKEVFTYKREVYESYEMAYKKYQLQPVDLKIDLFRVEKRIYFLDDRVYLGWRKYGKKGIDIHSVPGDHKTFLASPNDQKLAKVLQRVINTKV
ncbi:amino acid adenylation domain-containing protein [Pedobacter panaciterrae]|uniref:Amino acid adenylation domain-containing protein n=1 Tax=Pedobacter panaciterrae TaxID=363849 RepID=A0ABU8NF86_9SPHI|nr:amino acid adenylation domain-containing protein [uncultured Pedobacter sp.]